MLSYVKLFYYLLRPKTVFIRKRSGALGDDLLMSLVLPFIKKRYPEHKIIVEANWTDLFFNNPYVDWVTDKHLKTTRRHIKPKYYIDEKTKMSLYEQFMTSVGAQGKAYPELFLTDDELNDIHKRFNFPYIAICPHGKQKFSANRKEWGMENFQKLRNHFNNYQFVQVGLKNDELLDGVHDGRGLMVRQSAAIIKNSLFFVGLEGGLMHLAKSVGKRSVIIYGGFINPEISEYEENLNIINMVECSPCFRSYKKMTVCDTMICMKGISPDDVAGKINNHFRKELNSIKTERQTHEN
ncbi:MAG: glycosyltransferase family 9 protein [Calditrichaeota bacterium]|nr:glycosyltransferase family 9 protein [Calditrichota bacterium]